MIPSLSRFRRSLRWPLWLLSPLGSGHDFRGNPVLGSSLLNRMGLHVARLLMARLMTAWRRLWLRGLMPEHFREAYHRDGFVVVPGLLSDAAFAAVLADVNAAAAPVRECVQGDTLTHRMLLDDTTLAALPGLRALLEHPVFAGGVRYIGARNAHPLHYIQSIRNGVRPGRTDPQKMLHSDTFHPTMKAWFFLQDVDTSQGPLNYVPGSHRLTLPRLRWEYRRSLVAAKLQDGYSEKGSFRADDEDLRQLGLTAPRDFVVQANTLVIADTYGLHCRGAAAPGARRLEIWAYSRLNPFNPWPGINSRIWARGFTWLLQRKWEQLDQSAAARGELSSWHPVALEELHPEASGGELSPGSGK